MVACLLRSKVGSRGGRVLPRSGNDIIVCIGNDADDEEMFELLSGQEEAANTYDAWPNSFTVTVGAKPSHAMYYLDGHAQVLALLQDFQLNSAKANKYRSTTDLTRLE